MSDDKQVKQPTNDFDRVTKNGTQEWPPRKYQLTKQDCEKILDIVFTPLDETPENKWVGTTVEEFTPEGTLKETKL